MFQGIRRSGKAKARPHDVFQAGGQKAWIVRAFLCRHGLRIDTDSIIQVFCVFCKAGFNDWCIIFLIRPGDRREGFRVFPVSHRILDIKDVVNILVYAGPTALTDQDWRRCRIRRNRGVQVALPEVSRCHGGGPSRCVFIKIQLLVHGITMEPRHGRQESLERGHIVIEFPFQSVILNEEIVLIRHMDSSFIVRLR